VAKEVLKEKPKEKIKDITPFNVLSLKGNRNPKTI
jgi:hypothetical protein